MNGLKESMTEINNEQLHKETLAAVKNEKLATLVLLEYLAKVDACRLYAIMGYSTLWEYVHKSLKYSEAQTSERVSAMRLMVRVPEVKKELEAGNLSLTSTAKLASHVKRENYEAAQTLKLLNEVTGKSSREVERIFCSESTATARPDQVRVVALTDSSCATRITIDVDESFLNLMNRVKELGGHVGSTPQEVFKIAMSEYVKKREVKKIQTQNGMKHNQINAAEIVQKVAEPLRAPEVKVTNKKRTRYISKAVKARIRMRSGDQCEFKDPRTHRRCECKIALEYDHVVPFSLGGENILENLRHYCPAHNRLAAIQFFGEKKMRPYLKI